MLTEFKETATISQHSFERTLIEAWPPDQWQDVTILIAVSGGTDSVALLRGLAAIRLPGAGRVVVGHFNHRWRGAESDADEQFVQSLAAGLGLAIESGRSDAAGSRSEAAARRARYDFLQQTAERLGARYVVTAHTADDQVETVLQRIIRGTGLAGLAGMRRARPLGPAVTLLRPLLAVRRDELRDYLHAIGQSFRQDASNADRRFTRNRIRHELLPLLEEHYYRGAAESLLRLGRLAAEAQEVIDQQSRQLAEHSIAAKGGHLTIDCAVLASQPRYLVREVLMAAWRSQSWPLQAMGFDEWNQLAAMIINSGDQASPPRMLPGDISARREGRLLTLRSVLRTPTI